MRQIDRSSAPFRIFAGRSDSVEIPSPFEQLFVDEDLMSYHVRKSECFKPPDGDQPGVRAIDCSISGMVISYDKSSLLILVIGQSSTYFRSMFGNCHCSFAGAFLRTFRMTFHFAWSPNWREPFGYGGNHAQSTA